MKNRAFLRQEERKNIGNCRVSNRTADSAEKQKGEPAKGRITEIQPLNSTAESSSPE